MYEELVKEVSTFDTRKPVKKSDHDAKIVDMEGKRPSIRLLFVMVKIRYQKLVNQSRKQITTNKYQTLKVNVLDAEIREENSVNKFDIYEFMIFIL